MSEHSFAREKVEDQFAAPHRKGQRPWKMVMPVQENSQCRANRQHFRPRDGNESDGYAATSPYDERGKLPPVLSDEEPPHILYQMMRIRG